MPEIIRQSNVISGKGTLYNPPIKIDHSAESLAYIPVPGNSPNDTVGYITTYNIAGLNSVLDAPYVNLTG